VGYNNDYVEKEEACAKMSVHGAIFDKLINKSCSLKEAVNEVVEEKLASKNDAYKASLEIKKFIESY